MFTSLPTSTHLCVIVLDQAQKQLYHTSIVCDILWAHGLHVTVCSWKPLSILCDRNAVLYCDDFQWNSTKILPVLPNSSLPLDCQRHNNNACNSREINRDQGSDKDRSPHSNTCKYSLYNREGDKYKRKYFHIPITFFYYIPCPCEQIVSMFNHKDTSRG
jgi:hypothetical protein